MTAQHITDITDEITKVVVSGVTILDVDAIPDAVTLRAGETLLYPEPVGFISNIEITRDSLGSNSTAYKTFKYTLTYTYCYAPIGAGRGIKDYYKALAQKAQAIIYAIARHDGFADRGGLRVEVTAISNFGTVPAPNYEGGASTTGLFYGFRLTIAVLEFMEV